MSIAWRVHDSIAQIDAAAWDALRGEDDPFTRHTFLHGLEATGSIGPESGWQPQHLAIYEAGQLVAAAPAYLKGHSRGEFVFDWSWARAHAQHGLPYYPKLLLAVPWSPVVGPRLLVGTAADAAWRRRQLVDAAAAHAHALQLSSAHLNFSHMPDAAAPRDAHWLQRRDVQFHWQDRGWADFDDFLGALRARRRKNIRQERRSVARAGVSCVTVDGEALDEPQWTALHRFYVNTQLEHGNMPILKRTFFSHLATHMPKHVVATLCHRDGQLIAGALSLRGDDVLHGRYWGADEHVPALHFEACYYQGIEYCLRQGIARFEPGAQGGEHKMSRGFMPTPTRSFHWIADPRFRDAIAHALQQEGEAVDAWLVQLREQDPYREPGDAP